MWPGAVEEDVGAVADGNPLGRHVAVKQSIWSRETAAFTSIAAATTGGEGRRGNNSPREGQAPMQFPGVEITQVAAAAAPAAAAAAAAATAVIPISLFF